MNDSKSITKYLGVVLDDRYEIQEKVGEGGMAIVYKAMDNRLNRLVAVKLMREEFFHDSEFKKRFYDEAHAVAMLSHPNIVAIYDVSSSETIDYIVMELISGITLRQYMDKKRSVPWKQALHFSRQIAAALSQAHARGIVHRDIKPQNLMLLKDGTIKVADFGIAAMENEQQKEVNGQAVGSLNYIAPEQLRGLPADARGDIYSLGVTLYEMLSGFKPYNATSPAELLEMQKEKEILPLRAFDAEIPKGLEEIVLKALSKDPQTRYQSAEELVRAIDEFSSKFIRKERRKKSNGEEVELTGSPLKVSATPTINIPHREYVRSIRKANRIGFSLGSFALMVTIVALFGFLWSFWLKEIFSEAKRTEIPNFVGSNYQSILNDVSLSSKFRFSVNHVVDTSTAAGTVLSQSPGAGRSLQITEDGIAVKLSVSSGYALSKVSYVVGQDYREATLQLQKSGFNVEVKTARSTEVEKDRVISTSPAAGEEISAGSTVYITVSSGAEIRFVRMPNVIGLTEEAAIVKLSNSNLTYGGTERRTSDYDIGTVIATSVVAFADVEEYSTVFLTVSAGPGGY